MRAVSAGVVSDIPSLREIGGLIGTTVSAVFLLVIGLINLIPLPPFDGGHVMIATYEKIRELFRRDGRRYLADTNKILPTLTIKLPEKKAQADKQDAYREMDEFQHVTVFHYKDVFFRNAD